MDPPESRPGRQQFQKGKEIQGPRPSPLKVRKDATKFKNKPNKPPAGPSAAPPPQLPPEACNLPRAPVIIYTVSPKVIHATPLDFMSIVQHLTGPSPRGSPRLPLDGRFHAAGDRTSGVEGVAPEILDIELDARLDRKDYSPHGILSPLPSSLPTIPPNFFLPSPDPSFAGFFNDFSPSIYGNNGVDWVSPLARFSASPRFLSPGTTANRFL